MCGRFPLIVNRSTLEYFGLSDEYEAEKFFGARFNISPGQLSIIIKKDSPSKMYMMKWGLIPHWAKDPRIGYKMINARAETIDQKPAYKEPFTNKRCLVPASGFYEWKKEGNEKLPYYFFPKNTKYFSFAGIYDTWKDVEGKEFGSFSIITTSANSVVKSVHDRMPVILEKNDWDIWLDKNNKDIPELKKLLVPYNSKNIGKYRISIKVNNPRNEGISLIKRID